MCRHHHAKGVAQRIISGVVDHKHLDDVKELERRAFGAEIVAVMNGKKQGDGVRKDPAKPRLPVG
jgi:hypothetical protein